MATAVVPKIVLTVNHASGAGYYAMAGQGFDPDFILSWPTGRMGVMEGESAVMAVHGTEIERAQRERRELGARGAGRRSSRCGRTTSTSSTPGTRRRAGYVDAIVTPEETRDQLAFPLRVTRQLRRAAPRPLRAPAARRGVLPLGPACASVAPRRPAARRRARLRLRSPPQVGRPCPRPTSIPRRPRRGAGDASRPRATGPAPEQPAAARTVRRVAPPEVAYAHGWMPLASTGVDRFLRAAARATTAAAC